jgi:Ca2+-binding EF-hand superfamily protein
LNLDVADTVLALIIESLTDPDTKSVDYLSFVKTVAAGRNQLWKDTVESVLHRLREFLISHKINLARILEPSDRAKSGMVLTAQFVAALKKIRFDISEEDVIHIRDAYADTHSVHFIRWQKLCDDLDVVFSESEPSPAPPTRSVGDVLKTSHRSLNLYPPPHANGSTPRDSQGVPERLVPLIGSIAKTAEQFGWDARAELVIFDQFKRGTIPRTAFKETISLLPLKLPPALLDELIDLYLDSTSGRIQYQTFCDDLETINYEPPIPDEPELEAIEPRSLRFVGDVGDVPENLRPVLDRLRNFVRSHAFRLIELFKTIDKLNIGSVTSDGLACVLTGSIIHVSSEEFNALKDWLQDPHRPEQINYLKLCHALESENEIPSSEGIGTLAISQADDAEVANLVHRMGVVIRGKRSTFSRVFQGISSKLIPEQQFRQKLMDLAHFSLKPAEWRLLLKKYKANVRGDIIWKQFCDDSEKPFQIY